MRLPSENRPPVLHGLKVGIGTIEAARLWDIVRGTSRDKAAELLRASRLPDRADEERKIRLAYRGAAEETIAAQSRFLGMSEADYEALKAKLLEHWGDIQSFAQSVPSEKETRRLLELAGCPTDARKLGLRRKEIAESIASAHYIRDRFTVKKLCRILGVD
jgi:glycerol-1-phosphate dehydrogenase [NAD(P)+]